MGKMEDRIRALCYDEHGHIFTDEIIAPFLEEAMNRVPFLAASLIATSRGAHEAAEALLKWPVPRQEKSDGVEATTHKVAGETDSGK
jgi:hypothetical protein